MPLRSVSAAYLAQAGDLAGNPGQQAAYDSTGHCVVLAGPGSGKTKTLVLKLARIMAEDVRRLMDHLDIPRAAVMGYSMGARISAHLALAHPRRCEALLLGGLGIHLVEGVGLPLGITLAFGLGVKGAGIWIGLSGGLAVVAVLLIARWLRRERLLARVWDRR